MPGGDRTGPFAEGPMTGRGFGFCGGNYAPGYETSRGFGFGGRARGFGFGRGRGGGGMRPRRGPHWGFGPGAVVPPYPPPPYYPGAGEAELLRQEAQHLEASLQQIKTRLSELEKQEPKQQANDKEQE